MKRLLIFASASLLIIASCKSKKNAPTAPIALQPTNTASPLPTETKVEPTIGLNLGNQAPEIEETNLSGNAIKLSSLRGKLVLIDFWASWCGPCRKENPTVVKAYTKFKDQKFKGGNGFTIYSVSLDNDKALWEKAILKDGLVWPDHVSDLKVWNNEAAQKYGVQGIPYNVLINDKGIIINKNLRGEDLLLALEKLVSVE